MHARIAQIACTTFAALAVQLAVASAPAGAVVPLGQFGEGPGDQAGLLERPVGVAVDETGRVYVAERARISVYSPQGAFLRAFGKDVVPSNARTGFEQCTTLCKSGEDGGRGGELGIPSGLAVDAAGLLYVAETTNARISVFNQQGGFVGAFGKDVNPNNASTRFEVCTDVCQSGDQGARSGDLDNPVGITIDQAGLLWVADIGSNRVSVYTRNGTFLRAFGRNVSRNLSGPRNICTTVCGPGTASGEPGALDTPFAVAVDAAGNVYVSESANNRVSVFSPDLTFMRAFGEDVVPGNAETAFEVCSSLSGCKAGAPGSGAGALANPGGIAVADGTVYVAEFANLRVSRFSLDSAFAGALGRDVVPDTAETGFEECLAQCKEGLLGAGPGETTTPVLLGHDCRGALYVAERDNGRVERFAEPGTESPPCSNPAALSKPFGIMRVRRNTRAGTAVLTVSVPWSAELRLRGPGIKPAVRQAEFAGKRKLPVRPTGATARRLARFGQARLRIEVTYWPWGGKARTKSAFVTLRRGI